MAFTGNQIVIATAAAATKSVTMSGDAEMSGTGVLTDNKVWKTISSDNYTATPATTAQLTMADTTDLYAGAPLQYTIGGVTYYGQASAVTTDTDIDIQGAPMGGDLTTLKVGLPSQLVVVRMTSSLATGVYASATEADMFRDTWHNAQKWRQSAACLVYFAGIQASVDTGTEPKINIQINNAAVSTNDSNNGIQLGAADTWVGNSAVAINTSNYDIQLGEELEGAVTVAGGTGDAAYLTLDMVFVLKEQ